MKYKVGDKVRYLKNTTSSGAVVGEEYYIIAIDSINQKYSLGEKKGIYAPGMWVIENDIELAKLKHNEVEVDGVVYRKVYVSDESIQHALDAKDERILLFELPGSATYNYICVGNYDEGNFLTGKVYGYRPVKNIAEIPEPKEEVKTKVTLELTEEQLEQIKNIIS